MLTITEAKIAFHFQVDDLDKVQQRPQVMDEAMREAAYALADTLDQYIAAMYTEAATANLIGTTASPKTDVLSGGTNKSYDYLVDLSVLLDESNVPSAGRWVVVPPGITAFCSRFPLRGHWQRTGRIAPGQCGHRAGGGLHRHQVEQRAQHQRGQAPHHRRAQHGVDDGNAAREDRSIPARKAVCRCGRGCNSTARRSSAPQALAVLTANKPSRRDEQWQTQDYHCN